MFLKIVRLMFNIALFSILTACVGSSDSKDDKNDNHNSSSINSYKVFLDIAKNKTLVAYDMKLKFKKALPTISDIKIETATFVKNGRTVSALGPKLDNKNLVLSFGVWSKGKGDGVSNTIELMSFKSNNLIEDITVIDKNFLYSNGKFDSISSNIRVEQK